MGLHVSRMVEIPRSGIRVDRVKSTSIYQIYFIDNCVISRIVSTVNRRVLKLCENFIKYWFNAVFNVSIYFTHLDIQLQESYLRTRYKPI